MRQLYYQNTKQKQKSKNKNKNKNKNKQTKTKPPKKNNFRIFNTIITLMTIERFSYSVMSRMLLPIKLYKEMYCLSLKSTKNV